MNVWAGQAEQIQQVAQNVVKHTKQVVAPSNVEPHGILHYIIEHVPGGEWTVLGLMAFGASGLLWHKFHTPIENFIWRIVKRKMEQRKP